MADFVIRYTEKTVKQLVVKDADTREEARAYFEETFNQDGEFTIIEVKEEKDGTK